MSEQQWIPVSERLPDEQYGHNEPGARLFWVTDGKNCTSAWYVAELGKFGSNGAIYSSATHWVDPPLPTAPTTEG